MCLCFRRTVVMLITHSDTERLRTEAIKVSQGSVTAMSFSHTSGPQAQSISKLSPGSPHDMQLAGREMLRFLAEHQRGSCAAVVTIGGSTSRRCAH